MNNMSLTRQEIEKVLNSGKNRRSATEIVEALGYSSVLARKMVAGVINDLLDEEKITINDIGNKDVEETEYIPIIRNGREIKIFSVTPEPSWMIIMENEKKVMVAQDSNVIMKNLSNVVVNVANFDSEIIRSDLSTFNPGSFYESGVAMTENDIVSRTFCGLGEWEDDEDGYDEYLSEFEEDDKDVDKHPSSPLSKEEYFADNEKVWKEGEEEKYTKIFANWIKTKNWKDQVDFQVNSLEKSNVEFSIYAIGAETEATSADDILKQAVETRRRDEEEKERKGLSEGEKIEYRNYTISKIADRYDIWDEATKSYVGREENIADAKKFIDSKEDLVIEGAPALIPSISSTISDILDFIKNLRVVAIGEEQTENEKANRDVMLDFLKEQDVKVDQKAGELIFKIVRKRYEVNFNDVNITITDYYGERENSHSFTDSDKAIMFLDKILTKKAVKEETEGEGEEKEEKPKKKAAKPAEKSTDCPTFDELFKFAKTAVPSVLARKNAAGIQYVALKNTPENRQRLLPLLAEKYDTDCLKIKEIGDDKIFLVIFLSKDVGESPAPKEKSEKPAPTPSMKMKANEGVAAWWNGMDVKERKNTITQAERGMYTLINLISLDNPGKPETEFLQTTFDKLNDKVKTELITYYFEHVDRSSDDLNWMRNFIEEEIRYLETILESSDITQMIQVLDKLGAEAVDYIPIYSKYFNFVAKKHPVFLKGGEIQGRIEAGDRFPLSVQFIVDAETKSVFYLDHQFNVHDFGIKFANDKVKVIKNPPAEFTKVLRDIIAKIFENGEKDIGKLRFYDHVNKRVTDGFYHYLIRTAILLRNPDIAALEEPTTILRQFMDEGRLKRAENEIPRELASPPYDFKDIVDDLKDVLLVTMKYKDVNKKPYYVSIDFKDRKLGHYCDDMLRLKKEMEDAEGQGKKLVKLCKHTGNVLLSSQFRDHVGEEKYTLILSNLKDFEITTKDFGLTMEARVKVEEYKGLPADVIQKAYEIIKPILEKGGSEHRERGFTYDIDAKLYWADLDILKKALIDGGMTEDGLLGGMEHANLIEIKGNLVKGEARIQTFTADMDIVKGDLLTMLMQDFIDGSFSLDDILANERVKKNTTLASLKKEHILKVLVEMVTEELLERDGDNFKVK